MLRLELDFIPRDREHDVAIVIDVLRMTTTAAAMLAHGTRTVSVVADVEEARALATRTGALLYGERGGVALPGFDGGNSPLEHVGGDGTRQAVLCTTNGSRAVEGAAVARHTLLGAIVNAHAVASRALDLAHASITLVCAGTEGEPSLDDVLGAGLILRELVALAGADDLDVSDACVVALDVAAAEREPLAGLRRARHARTLADLGFDADIIYAAGLNRLSAVPEREAVRPARFAAAPARPR